MQENLTIFTSSTLFCEVISGYYDVILMWYVCVQNVLIVTFLQSGALFSSVSPRESVHGKKRNGFDRSKFLPF